MATNTDREFVRKKISELRQRLLDLTARNPLLNFRHPKGSSVRIVDELPDQVVTALQANRSFYFEPVPRPSENELVEQGYIDFDPVRKEEIARRKPTPEAWAKYHGIATPYEMPEGSSAGSNHRDTRLQTLLFPESLEARLRSVRTRANSAETEMGCNILFLAVGFLEWSDSEDSEITRIAPLYTLPVELVRDRLNAQEGAFRYKITPRDEDALDNITLREKLRSDFGLELPPILDEEPPEQYFDKVRASIIQHQPRWKLHRYITLATFNFQKQAMYEDLDPERWGTENSILDHPLVREFFVATEREEDPEAEAQEEYAIDELPNAIDNYPIVYDADSSQHSAIVDALDGKNLVIEGPPGTGKSQTITNLIAACIAAGKTVLFVAEKMAALEVVKNRLDRAGLGDFCLELHGHKAQKSAVLETISERLHGKYSIPGSLEVEKQVLQSHRDTLNGHADHINSEWKSTGKTPHQFFSAAVFYRGLHADKGELPTIPTLSGETLTPLFEKTLLDKTQRLATLHSTVAQQTPDGTLPSHYWHGLRKINLLQEGSQKCVRTLREWTDCLESLKSCLSSQLRDAGIHSADGWSIESLTQFETACTSLPPLSGNERFESVAALSTRAETCSKALALNLKIHSEWESLGEILEFSALDDDEFSAKLRANASRLRPLGVAQTTTLAELSDLEQRLRELLAACSPIQSAFDQIQERVPSAFDPCLHLSIEGLDEYLRLAKLIRALPNELWRFRDPLFDNYSLDYLIEELRAKLGSLVAIRSEIESTFDLVGLPNSRELESDLKTIQAGGLFRILSSDWRSAKRRVLARTHGDKPSKKSAFRLLPELVRYAQGLEEAQKLNQENPSLGEEYRGVDTPIERIAEIRTWYKSVRAEYGEGFGRRADIADALFTLDRETAVGIADYNAGELFRQIGAQLVNIRAVSQFTPNHPLAQSLDCALSGENGSIDSALSEVSAFLQATAPHLKGITHSLIKLSEISTRLNKHADDLSAWQGAEIQTSLQATNFNLSSERGTRNPAEVAALRETLALAKSLSSSSQLLAAFCSQPGQARYEALRSSPETLRPLLDAEANASAQFVDAGDVDLSAWSESCGQDIAPTIERNLAALTHEEWVSDWLGYLRVKQQLIPEGLEAFIRHLEETSVSVQDVDAVTRAVINVQISKEIIEQDASLGQFYGPDQDTIRTSFHNSDRKVINLKQAEIASCVSKRKAPQGKTGGRVAEYTDMALVKREVEKKKRHIALRDLLNRAGDAVIALKPCFMMSPMSVATHLDPGRHRFDLVVMDEASQIKPEDALGSIARANSLVIVGDPKQLPPTSFFDRAVDGEDVSEDGVTLDDSESILEAVTGMFPTRRLRWHYRSRHESLIAFSAENFYDSDLVLFPSPFEVNDEFGVKFHKVEDGFFQKVNKPEARAVVDFVIEQLRTRPNETVGVVAMSATQSTLISEEIEQRMKDDPIVRKLIDDQIGKDEPLFLKNLESVQGDERDVIVISMTYGPVAPGGTVPQRFGPINNSGGWRRLNVLFTRAKKRMHIFSSMSASDVGKEGGRGRKALHNFLAYCERVPMADGVVTERPVANDFEASVMAALEAEGYACTPQLGVAGYFLDIAVRDPEDPGRYLLGVECDGATYHSAKSARDRDRLRQEVLEGLGWKITRIWSTDWFKNPDLQIQKVLNVLKACRPR